MAGFFDFMANPTRFQAIARPVRASAFLSLLSVFYTGCICPYLPRQPIISKARRCGLCMSMFRLPG